MGMAHHAPMDRAPKHFITDHAVQRIREYLPNDYRHLPDTHIRNRLDEAIIDATARGVLQQTTDTKGEAAWFIPLQDTLDHDLTLLVKEFVDEGTGVNRRAFPGRKAAVTVLRPEAVENIKARLKTGVKLGDKYGDKLADMRDELEVAALAPRTLHAVNGDTSGTQGGVSVAPFTPPTSTGSITSTSTKPPEQDTRLVTFTDKDGKTVQTEFLASELQGRLLALLASGVAPNTIRAWKPVKLNLTFVIGD